MKDTGTKTIFLADAEKHVRNALRLMLEHQPSFLVIGEAGTAESLLAQACQRQPDVILLDWNLPGLHPQRLLMALSQCCPETITIATSVKPEHEKIAQEYGLQGFLLKLLPPENFLSALLTIVLENQQS